MTDAKLMKLRIFFHERSPIAITKLSTARRSNATRRNATPTPTRSVSFYWRCSSRRERAILCIRDYAREPSSASDRVRFRETIEPGAIDARGLREIMSIIAPTFYPEDLYFEKSLDTARFASHRVAFNSAVYIILSPCGMRELR